MRQKLVAFVVLSFVGVRLAYAVCDDKCKNITESCFSGSAGATCLAANCYRYTSQSSSSCFTCGPGSGGGGYCQVASPGPTNNCITQMSPGPSPVALTITFDFFNSCTPGCTGPAYGSKYIAAGLFSTTVINTGTEDWQKCGLPL